MRHERKQRLTRETLTTNKIALPVGPFSPAVRAGEFVYLSGQVAQDPATGRLIAGDAAMQTDQIFKNVQAILDAGGRTMADVIKATVFLTDMRDYPAMNTIFGRYFEAPYPARTTVAVMALPLGAAVEIDLVVK